MDNFNPLFVVPKTVLLFEKTKNKQNRPRMTHTLKSNIHESVSKVKMRDNFDVEGEKATH